MFEGACPFDGPTSTDFSNQHLTGSAENDKGHYFIEMTSFDVGAQAAITVKKPQDRYNYEGRAHSLWYCDAQEEGAYRWYETAFIFIDKSSTINPFSLAAPSGEAALCFSMVMSGIQIAWGPLAFDQGDEEQFIERWLGWFAAAVNGGLKPPQ